MSIITVKLGKIKANLEIILAFRNKFMITQKDIMLVFKWYITFNKRYAITIDDVRNGKAHRYAINDTLKLTKKEVKERRKNIKKSWIF